MSHKKAYQLTPQQVNSIYPVVELRVYRDLVEVVRTSWLQGERGRGNREKVKGFSRSSWASLLFTVNCCAVRFQSLLTLTYSLQFPNYGPTIKNDLRKFLAKLKREYGYFDVLWVLEFQSRGAAHFHLLTTLPRPTLKDARHRAESYWLTTTNPPNWVYFDLKRERETTCRYAAEKFIKRDRMWEALETEKGAKRYITEYALKARQKKPPEWFRSVGRFWGHNRDLPMEVPQVYDVQNLDERDVIRAFNSRVADWEVLPKYVLRFDNGEDR
jgi:hypothetical protein